MSKLVNIKGSKNYFSLSEKFHSFTIVKEEASNGQSRW